GYVGAGVTGLGAFYVLNDQYGPAILLDLIGLGCLLGEHSTIVSDLAIDLELRQGGQTVWRGHSSETEREKHWAMSVGTARKVNVHGAAALDRVLTVSVRKMLGEIEGLGIGAGQTAVGAAPR
ncbi:MAG: hypothetical protein AB1505_36900, partial [Candidatus Latescibacterota bacterium]